MSRSSAYILSFCILVLIAIGFIMLMSTGAYTQEGQHDAWAAVKRQGRWLIAGLIACAGMAMINYRLLYRFAWPLFWVTVILLVLCFVPGVGVEVNSARRWIGIGSQRLGQPSELAKIGTMVALAAWCAANRHRSREFLRGFLFPLLIVCVPVGLIACEVDLGTAGLLFAGCTIVLYLSGARTFYVGGMVFAGVLALAAAVVLIPNRTARVTAFLHLEDPEFSRSHPELHELNWQQQQGAIALGSGGIHGRGLGESRQKQYYLPLPHTDFVFAVLGEELGLTATLGVIALFLVAGFTGMLIAIHAPDRFGKLLGSGLIILIIGQSVINIGVATGALPNKGMPLPFISYGGSNLFSCLLSIGILLNIYRHARDPQEDPDPVLQRQKLTPAV